MNFCMNLYELKHNISIGTSIITVGMHRAAILTVIFLYGMVSRSQPAP